MPSRGRSTTGGPPGRKEPKLRFRVSARCYQTVELFQYFPSFNSLTPPRIQPTELSPACPKPAQTAVH
ncbi:hypothetical protein THIX_90567 [Thiomonas sp. X19]|nr:hypothetical protein THIX_90567 [Thiomonas sp. X19]